MNVKPMKVKMKIGKMIFFKANISFLPIRFLFPVALAILFITGCGKKQKDIVQPISYNHKIHYTEVGLDCTDCHKGVENDIRATLPSLKVCEACHSEPQGDSPEEAKVVEAVNSNTEIQWKRIYRVPEHVFFSHRRHVTAGKIACEECHGKVDELTAPAPRQLVPIKMKNCMKCHDNKSISNDCIHCHV